MTRPYGDALADYDDWYANRTLHADEEIDAFEEAKWERGPRLVPDDEALDAYGSRWLHDNARARGQEA